MLFPAAGLAILSSDTVRSAAEAEAFFKGVESGEIDIIIGTQMAAKGHDFPRLTLVGVIDADLGIAGGDLRAAERTYQLLWQVAGRSGRAEHKGRALVQTFQPSHPVVPCHTYSPIIRWRHVTVLWPKPMPERQLPCRLSAVSGTYS